jgi:hypothetical protein
LKENGSKSGSRVKEESLGFHQRLLAKEMSYCFVGVIIRQVALQKEETVMYFGTRSFTVIGFTLLACLGPCVYLSEAQQIRIEGVFPRQLPRGQATLINVAVPSRDMIQAAEISPSAGVNVSSIKRAKTSKERSHGRSSPLT